MIKNSFTVGFIILPFAHIFTPISPGLGSHSFSHSIFPFSFIGYSIVKLNWRKLHDGSTVNGGFYEFIIFLCFTSFEQVSNSFINLSVSIALCLYCVCGRYGSSSIVFWLLLFFFFFLGLFVGGWRLIIIFGRIFIFLLFLFREEILIFCCFEIALFSFKVVGGKVVFDLFFIVGIDFRYIFFYF